MDQEAFEIAIERELADVFGYNYHMKEQTTVQPKSSLAILFVKASLAILFVGIVGFLGIVVILELFFIFESLYRGPTASGMNLPFATVIFLGGLIVIIIGGIGLLVLYKYKKLKREEKKKIEEEKKAKEIKKQRLLETLMKLDNDIYNESVGKNLTEIKEIAKSYSTQEASNLLVKEDIRKRICPALKSATDDVFDISKAVTPVLVGCVVAGTVSIPLNPILFAAIAVVIARMGISALCAGFITK